MAVIGDNLAPAKKRHTQQEEATVPVKTKREMRVILPALVSLAVLLGACGTGNSGSTPQPATFPTSASGSAAIAGGVQLPPAETTKVTIGLSNDLAVGQFLDKFAADLGLFQKYGLDVDVVSFQGDGKLVQALVAGQIQGSEGSGGSAISSQLTDTPLVVTTLNNVSLPYDLIGGKDIKTAADLKGKLVGVSSFGSVAHAVVLAALEQLGLTSADVVVTQIGNEAARISAVSAGSIAAAPVTVVNAQPLIDDGLNVLVDLTDAHIKYATAGLTVRKDWVKDNQGTVLRMIAAILEAQKTLWDQPDLAVEKYVAFTQTDEATAKAAIDAYIQSEGNKGLRFTQDAFTIPLEVTKSVNPEVDKVDLASVYDLSYLDKLESLGFNDAISFP